MKHSLSIVIVTHNRADDLKRCLHSIQSQTLQPSEIIIVDNASTDHTQEMLQHISLQVTIYRQSHNTGAPTGRNIGILHAQSSLVLCLDDDTKLLEADAIERGISYFTANNRLACLSFTVVSGDGSIDKKLIPRRDRRRISEDTPGAMFTATGCIFLREAFMEVGGFWEKLSPYFGEEPELSYRLLEQHYEIILTPHIRVMHFFSMLARPSTRRMYYGVRNTPWIALRHLPFYSVISLTLLSWGYFFINALLAWQLKAFFRAVIASIQGLPDVYALRKPVSKTTLHHIWKYSGVYLY